MGYICGNGEDLELCMITGSRIGLARGEGGRHMKEKIKRDLVDLWIRGRGEFGRGGGGFEMKVRAQ